MSTHSFTQYHTFFYGYFVLTSTRGKCIIYSDYCIRPDQGDISMEKTKIAKPEKDKLELHELLQRIALIVGFVAIFVAIIATNARNEGCFTIRYSKDTGNLLYTLFVFSAKSESIKIAFLTPKLTSVLAASLSVASLGLTGASNIINRKFKKTDYIVGGFAVILSALTIMAAFLGTVATTAA